MAIAPLSIREIDTIDRFTTKVGVYIRHRWQYPPEAIAKIFAVGGLDNASVVADIGAGPGTVTRHLVGRVRLVYAVEPNNEMRRQATDDLGNHPGFVPIAGRAEATTLSDHSVDAITVGRALHWFDPEPSRLEFLRILKPDGWLAIIGDERTQVELDEAIRAISTNELGWRTSDDKSHIEKVSPAFFFGHDRFDTYRFHEVNEETWEMFLGRLTSRSSAPDPDHPLRWRYEQAARSVFDRFSQDGILASAHNTLVRMGRPV